MSFRVLALCERMLFLKSNVIILKFWIMSYGILMLTAGSSSYVSDKWYKFSKAAHPPPQKSRNINWNVHQWQGTLQICPYYLQRDKGYTTTHSDFFCQRRNSHCEMLQSLRVWEVSINRNNPKIKTDYWSKIRTLSLTECNDTKNLRKHRTQMFILITSECIKIEIRSKKCAPNQFCRFWCCRNRIRLWFLFRIWKLKDARENIKLKTYHIWHHRGCIHIKKTPLIPVLCTCCQCIWHLWQWICTNKKNFSSQKWIPAKPSLT